MVLISSRILSCEVWLILMRKTSAPASNRRLIIALSDDAGPRVARILMRRRRLMACFRAPWRAADLAHPGRFRPADWTGPECFRLRPGRSFPEYPAPVVRAVRWTR